VTGAAGEQHGFGIGALRGVARRSRDVALASVSHDRPIDHGGVSVATFHLSVTPKDSAVVDTIRMSHCLRGPSWDPGA
jgi:hypothetical protein